MAKKYVDGETRASNFLMGLYGSSALGFCCGMYEGFLRGKGVSFVPADYFINLLPVGLTAVVCAKQAYYDSSQMSTLEEKINRGLNGAGAGALMGLGPLGAGYVIGIGVGAIVSKTT